MKCSFQSIAKVCFIKLMYANEMDLLIKNPFRSFSSIANIWILSHPIIPLIVNCHNCVHCTDCMNNLYCKNESSDNLSKNLEIPIMRVQHTDVCAIILIHWLTVTTLNCALALMIKNIRYIHQQIFCRFSCCYFCYQQSAPTRTHARTHTRQEERKRRMQQSHESCAEWVISGKW